MVKLERYHGFTIRFVITPLQYTGKAVSWQWVDAYIVGGGSFFAGKKIGGGNTKVEALERAKKNIRRIERL